MIEHIYADLKVGDYGYVEKTLSETDVYMYAGITGDFGWLHVNKVRAEEGRYGQRIVHGMLLMGLISNVVSSQMPGAGTIYQSQEAEFLKPCFINDTVRASAEVMQILPKGRVRLRTRCYNQFDELLVDGSAVVIPPRERVMEARPQKVIMGGTHGE